MVDGCHAAGVSVISDVVWNHMTNMDSGVGLAGSSYSRFDYPGIYQSQVNVAHDSCVRPNTNTKSTLLGFPLLRPHAGQQYWYVLFPSRNGECSPEILTLADYNNETQVETCRLESLSEYVHFETLSCEENRHIFSTASTPAAITSAKN